MRTHLLLLLSCLALGLLVPATGVRAQHHPSLRETPSADGVAPNHDRDINLPEWARPNASYGQPSPWEDASAQQSSPPLPPAPSPVPLGGLEWLALAGGAYAVNRMRRRSGVDGDSSEALP